MSQGLAVITGASSGIGEATARRLAAEGFEVVLGARRLDRIEALAKELGGRGAYLDVTDTDSVASFVKGIDECAVLVNNAGGALGRDEIATADEEQWRWMFDANVLGMLRITQRLLPALKRSGDGRIVVISSLAGSQTYPGGGGYNAAKFGAHTFADVLRMETVADPIRVIEIAPGLVETEFALVRFDGDQAMADAVYAGITPLVADDIADCISFAVTRPSHITISQLEVLPRDQATATLVHRSANQQ